MSLQEKLGPTNTLMAETHCQLLVSRKDKRIGVEVFASFASPYGFQGLNYLIRDGTQALGHESAKP